MTLPANIRINVRTAFPSRVKGSGFVTVSKANGVFTIGADYTQLARSAGISPTQIMALFDTQAGTWSYVSALGLASSFLEELTIVTNNVIPQLSYSYATGGKAVVYVNGQAFFPLGATPAFTINGTTVTWSAANSGVTITPSDTVVVEYAHT